MKVFIADDSEYRNLSIITVVGVALYSLGRIVRPHQAPGACSDIFELKFCYDNDYGNGEPARIRRISGRTLDDEIRVNLENRSRNLFKRVANNIFGRD